MYDAALIGLKMTKRWFTYAHSIAHLHFTFARCKWSGQGRSHFDCEYIVKMMRDRGYYSFVIKYSMLTHSKCQRSTISSWRRPTNSENNHLYWILAIDRRHWNRCQRQIFVDSDGHLREVALSCFHLPTPTSVCLMRSDGFKDRIDGRQT